MGCNNSDFSSRNTILNYRMMRLVIVSIMIISDIYLNYIRPTLMLVSGAPFVNIHDDLGIQDAQYEYLCPKHFCEKRFYLLS